MKENYLIKNKKLMSILIQKNISSLNQYLTNSQTQNLIVEQTSAQKWGIEKMKEMKLENKLKSKQMMYKK